MDAFSKFIVENILALILLAAFLGWQLGRRRADNKKTKIIIADESVFRQRMVFLAMAIGLVAVFFLAIWLPEQKKKEKVGQDLFSVEKQEVKLDPEIYHLAEQSTVRGLNLIFFADGYGSWEEFDQDVSVALAGLKKFSPWSNYQYFNVHKIKPTGDKELCQVKTENERKPVLRCDQEINGYLEKMTLKNFRLVVFSRQDFQSWANLSRVESSGIFFSVPKKIEEAEVYGNGVLLAHLFGHSFGLKDEEKFVIAKAGGAPHTPDGPNCAPDEATARKWWGDLAEKYSDRVGFFPTCCGDENYIRPTLSSLMNLADNMENFQPSYGPVSEQYLEKILRYCFSPEKFSLKDDPEFFGRYSEVRTCLKTELDYGVIGVGK
jgi:hypothetical protein